MNSRNRNPFIHFFGGSFSDRGKEEIYGDAKGEDDHMPSKKKLILMVKTKEVL